MSRRRLLLPLGLAAVLVAVVAALVLLRVPDPLDDYPSLRRAAEARGRVTVAARGEVVTVLDDQLFRIQSDELPPERMLVFSRSSRDIGVGTRVSVEGTLFARGAHGVDTGRVPDAIEGELCRDGLLVADEVVIYQGQMHR